QIHIRVAQQRKDRVIERRRRDLDLAAGRSLPVLRDDTLENLEFHLPQSPPVGLRETPAFGDQLTDASVPIEVVGIDPGKLVPDLQVTNIVGRKQGYLGSPT